MEEHVEAGRKPSVYVVVAYRWGTLNNHNYIVAATADRAGAIAAAKEERDGRGYKYGVEVVEYPAEKSVAYFPSAANAAEATGPEHSDDLSAAHYIGDAILSAFQSGVRSAPSGQKIDTPGGPVETLKQVPAEFSRDASPRQVTGRRGSLRPRARASGLGHDHEKPSERSEQARLSTVKSRRLTPAPKP